MVNQKEHCQRIAAVKRNSTVDKLIKTLVELMQKDQPISLKAVIEKSGVSQSWIYKNPELKTLIECLSEYAPGQSKYFREINKRLKNIEEIVLPSQNINE